MNEYAEVNIANEESVIKNLFRKGYKYSEILFILNKHYNIDMSYRTLLRRLASYGLQRRSMNCNIDYVTQRVRTIVDGPGCLGGYRTIWRTLQLEGVHVRRRVVAQILRELDPEGTEMRRAHKLRRRQYHCAGPNFSWHLDGYDKLKPYGISIHGCIDGYSRKILWLEAMRSNKNPSVIAKIYLDTVEKYGGCPISLHTDLGTENGTVAAIQSFFLNNTNAHKYVSSQRNQRIEGWWSFFRRSRTTWWINFFKDLIDENVFDPGDVLQVECLWFCFIDILQSDLSTVVANWNSHYIRKSRYDTVPGRPDVLYFTPELSGGVSGLLKDVSENDFGYAKGQLIEEEQNNIYQDYFEYVLNSKSLEKPTHWRYGLSLYKELMRISRGDHQRSS